MRNRSALMGIVVFLIALSLPLIIFSQQNRSATRVNPERAAAGRPTTGKSPVTTGVIKHDLGDALAIIQANYIDGNKLDFNSVFKSSISGMLSVLDPHSTYFDPIEFASFKTEQRSEYFGIGATIGDLRDNGEVNTFIRATFQGAPASQAGLRFGDQITEIDGQSMKNKPYPEVRKLLIGPRGTKVKVTVKHLSGKTDTVEITRDAVPLPSVPEAYIVRPGVGYVAMTGGFNLTTADEFQRALSDLHKKGMNTLILDLRGNHGGLLIQAVRVADAFLKKGQSIVSQKGRIRGSSETFTALKAFVARNPEFKVTAEQLDRDRVFVEKQLRYELSTAAFGSTTALQIYNSDDPQIARAVDVMPRARELALAALRAQQKPL